MAYAHYEAGMAFYKVKRVDRMAVYFENFLKLAPERREARGAVDHADRARPGWCSSIVSGSAGLARSA